MALVVRKWSFSVGYYWEDTDGVKRSVQNHPLSVKICPTVIPHGMSWDGSRSFFVRGLRLTAWTMAGHWIFWSCLWQKGRSNVQLKTHCPIKEENQRLNGSGKNNFWLLNFWLIFISFTPQNKNVTKNS